MSPCADGAEFGRVRWKRFAIIIIPAAIVASAMILATAEGVLAASFAVSGNVFKFSVDELQATGFAQFGALDHEKDGTPHPVLVSAFRHATITNLCQSAKVGPFVARFTAGRGSRRASASNLVIDIASLHDDVAFTNLQSGRDASTLNEGPPGVVGAAGMFGQQATTIRLTDIKATAWALTAGTFKLPGLSVGFGSECF